MTTCKHADSSCNYPEGECLGVCMKSISANEKAASYRAVKGYYSDPVVTDQQVHKYTLPVEDWCCIQMPCDAEILCVQVQHGAPRLWARVSPDAPMQTRHFRVAGTGHDLGSNVGRYIGTFQIDGGALVFHVFEEAAPLKAREAA